MIKTLTTKRLILRAITEDDIPAIFAYAKNPNVGPHAGWAPHKSIEDSEKISKEIFIGKEGNWGIVRKEDGKFMGSAGLVHDVTRPYEKSKMIGYSIGEEYWGNGYMTEAVKELLRYGFEEEGLELIHIRCKTTNPRSQRVIEKCGFISEGILRKVDKHFTGEVVDMHHFSLTKDEYIKAAEAWK